MPKVVFSTTAVKTAQRGKSSSGNKLSDANTSFNESICQKKNSAIRTYRDHIIATTCTILFPRAWRM
jgi:hypothetical protein